MNWLKTLWCSWTHGGGHQTLHIPPASKPWVGLTEEEAAATAYKSFDEYWTEDCKGREKEAWAAAGRAIEAKLREKNTGEQP